MTEDTDTDTETKKKKYDFYGLCFFFRTFFSLSFGISEGRQMSFHHLYHHQFTLPAISTVVF